MRTDCSFRSGISFVLMVFLLCGPPRSASADPPQVGNDGRGAPLLAPVPVTVPGPQERQVPVPGTESLQDPAARVTAITSHWVRSDGTPHLRLVRVDVAPYAVVVVLEDGDWDALGDHVRELFVQAVEGALGPTLPGIPRALHIRGRSQDALLGPVPDPGLLRPPLELGGDGATDRDRVPPPTTTYGPKSAVRSGTGALVGRRIALSPGHGLFWTGSSWTTQRGDSYGLIEDDLTSTIARWHVEPYLQGLGAESVWLRERDDGSHTATVIDNGSADYAEAGTFATQNSGEARGGNARTTTDGAAVATFTIRPGGGLRPLHVWWPAGAALARGVTIEVVHDGGTTAVVLDQSRGGPAWQRIGRFSFVDGGALRVRGQAGATVAADAVMVGTSTGAVRRNGTAPPGRGWRESSRNYAEFSGAPTAVYQARATERDSDIVARPLWANRLNVDAYVSIHTNAAGGTGTETFIYNGTATANSAGLRGAIHQQVIDDIRAWWNPAWADRGLKSADFGEVRELTNAPGALIEVAFHDRNPDTGPDVPSLQDPKFRRIAGRAIARGVQRFLAPGTPFVPEPPTVLALQNEERGLVLRWNDPGAVQGAGAATDWWVEIARDGGGYDAGRLVGAAARASGYVLPEVPFGQTVAVRIAGANPSGRGPYSVVLSARSAGGQAAGTLIVGAFDRWDRAMQETGNTFDYLARVGAAITAAPEATAAMGIFAFDSAWASAVDSLVALDDYAVVVWQLGEESTADETFSDAHQAAVRDLLTAGGRLIVSGAELGWDLGARGSASDQAFLRDQLRVAYVADDANTQQANPVVGGVLDGVGALTFDDGTAGIQAIDFPDVLDAVSGSQVVLRYPDGRGAGVISTQTAVFGFPLEAITDDARHAAVMGRLLQWAEAPRVLAPPDEPDPVEPEPVEPTPDAGGTDTTPDTSSSDTGPQDAGPDAVSPDTSSPDTGTPDSGTTPDASGDLGGFDVPAPPEVGPIPDGATDPNGPPIQSFTPKNVEVNAACGCSAASPTPVWGWMVLVAGAGVWRRRQRQSR